MSYILTIAIFLVIIIRILTTKTVSRFLNFRLRSDPSRIFNHYYIDVKEFYIYRFNTVPCTTYIDSIDVSKAFNCIRDNFGDQIVETFQACFFNKQANRQEFHKTVFVLKRKVLIELTGEMVVILHTESDYEFANNLLLRLGDFKLPEKVEDFEINIITYDEGNLSLKRLNIKPASLDLGLFYNDDFLEVHEQMCKRLNQSEDKGIVLLHGLPGTGKTSYLRHLIGELKKRVLFVSPSVAGNLMNPKFLDLLIDNPNSILIIEDAENIMMDRKFNTDSSVSNLLNLSDGLLSDSLGVQIICTFNSSLDLIDSALMRKGRLIARYEFGKLSVGKSQNLSLHLGFDSIIRQPMTIAEIANQDEKTYARQKESVGFRIQEAPMN